MNNQSNSKLKKKKKNSKKAKPLFLWGQTFKVWPQNTVSFIHRKSRVFLWLGVCCHLEAILYNIQYHSGFGLPTTPDWNKNSINVK